MFDRKLHRIINLAAPLLLVPLIGGFSMTAAAQQDATASSTSNTTNLGTMVVAPQHAPNPSSAPQANLKVQRHSLNLDFGPGSSAPAQPPTSKPQQALPHPAVHHPVKRVPPSPLHIVQPQYPANAYASEQKGTVTVGFTITSGGSTTNIHILDSHPSGVFDNAAREAVSQWLFQPATENGQPVAVNVSQTLVFRPPHPATAKAARSTRHSGAPPADSVPGNIHPLHLVPPQYPSRAYRLSEGGVVTVSFVVRPNGHTARIKVLYSKPRVTFNNAAMNAVRQWRFKPVNHTTRVVQTIRFTPPD